MWFRIYQMSFHAKKCNLLHYLSVILYIYFVNLQECDIN